MSEQGATPTTEVRLRPPARPMSARVFDIAVLVGLVLVLAISFNAAQMYKFSDLIANSSKMGRYLSAFLHPDFTYWRLYLEELLNTMAIAVWGTLLAVIFASVFGVLSARNMAPWWVVQPVRRLMDAFRAINEFVIAAIFLVAVGLGPFAGVMALSIHTTGVLAKLFSEAIEAMDPGAVEGVRATGARRVHEVIWGVVPQVAPLWTSYALYRFESNTRSATVLGLIGAGGIGQVLFESIRGFQYEMTAAVVIMIVVAVSAIDVLSQVLRQRLT